MSDTAALAAATLGLGREPWNDPASRKRGSLQYELSELERRYREVRRTAADLSERVKAVRADLEAMP